MPTFSPGLALRPARDGHLHQLAHALLVQRLEGVVGEDPLLHVAGRKLPASSRESPMVVWVRSLVPKEKNSASSAISSAVSAARGSSIMVPTR